MSAGTGGLGQVPESHCAADARPYPSTRPVSSPTALTSRVVDFEVPTDPSQFKITTRCLRAAGSDVFVHTVGYPGSTDTCVTAWEILRPESGCVPHVE
jgi:hypothetical protein